MNSIGSFSVRVLILISLMAPAYGNDLSVVGVQFEISPHIYENTDIFRQTAVSLVQEAVLRYQPDLIVFPEYTGVFFQLISLGSIFSPYENWEDLSSRFREINPDFHISQVFLDSEEMISLYLEIWSNLSRQYGVTIVAGTCFVPVESQGSIRLVNRAFVVTPQGEIGYTQDKVFLTDFESSILGLSPGLVTAAKYFTVEGKKVCLSICRDTFFHQWESIFAEAFLWIDIKANGESYGPEQQELFQRALPARLEGSQIPYGITVCTVGSYLDLFWEGQSSLIYNSGKGILSLSAGDTVDRMDCIHGMLLDSGGGVPLR